MKKYYFEIKNWKILWFFPTLEDWKYKITEVKRVRSLDQNRLYWGYIIKYIVLKYKEVWILHTKDYIHDKLKRTFLKKERVYSHFSKKFVLQVWTTTNLNTKKFSEFIEKIKIFCEHWVLWEIKGLEDLEPFVIPDIDETLDEIFTEIADNKEATEDAKEDIAELREFKADLQDILDDIQCGDIEDEECKEIIDDIKEAQKNGEQEEDFGFTEELLLTLS